MTRKLRDRQRNSRGNKRTRREDSDRDRDRRRSRSRSPDTKALSAIEQKMKEMVRQETNRRFTEEAQRELQQPQFGL